MREKIEILFEEVKKLEKKSNLTASASHASANEASGGLAASYSAAGDAEHSRNTANLSMQKYQSIKKLSEELRGASYQDNPQSAKTPCYILLQIGGDPEKEVYLVENPVFMSGFNLVSPMSPIGNALMGHKAGDLFLYTSGGQTFTGKVLEIG